MYALTSLLARFAKAKLFIVIDLMDSWNFFRSRQILGIRHLRRLASIGLQAYHRRSRTVKNITVSSLLCAESPNMRFSSLNRLLHGFDCEIRVDVADNVTERRIPAAKDRIEKLHQLRQELRLRLVEAQERMATYYNARHVPKQFRVGDFVKLSTKNLKLKYRKLSPRWIGPFRVLERIGGQAYRLALPEK
jgi:hypothetical protein